ncbi:MAG TPA: NAD-dependent 4,6-dehydratase LegB [Coriobacteriia bacterium]|nr:NAD-dependent 4,6-dehydratase LegB [Coriobacteriia bacterium]
MQLRGKKVVVTGSDGFIGSHLVEALVEHGADVRAFTYYNSFGSRGWLDTLPAEIQNSIEVVMGDVRDAVFVRKSLEDADVCMHLAALIAIPYSYFAPDSYVDTNIRGTLNVLQAARDFELERVAVTSTSEVYGTAQYAPIDEKHPLQGQSPYSASKIGADKMAESYYRSFDLPVVTVRPFNTYGPRQSARAVIPTIITQLCGGAEQIKLGSLHPTRDLNFAKDTVAGMIALTECDEAIGRDVNIGSGREITVGELAQLLIDMVRPGTEIISSDERLRPEKSEVERLLADTTLIKSLTDWAPKYTLEEGLAETIEWFSDPANLSRYRWDIYNV